MASLRTWIIAAALSLLGLQAIGAEAFVDVFRETTEGSFRIPGRVERRARDFRYVFVGGFASEGVLGYFAQSRHELRLAGVPTGSIHTIFPSSHLSADANGETVRADFLRFAASGPEPLVIIGHSRGACDTLAFALNNEAFVRDRVRAIFLVQGAFGGTGAADYMMGEGSLMDHRMPWRLRLLAYAVGRFERFMLHRGKHGGLAGLTRSGSKQYWAQALATHAGAIGIVGPKTFYVTSHIDPSRLGPFHRAIGVYLHTYYGPNDGMVALRDQTLPGLGTCLAVLDAGHTDLTHRFPSTLAPRRYRRALIQSILMTVADDHDSLDAGVTVKRIRRRGH